MASDFTVAVHFSNGISFENFVSLKKAVKLAMKRNVIVPTDASFVEVRGVNTCLYIPEKMVFVVPGAPNMRHLDGVTKSALYKRDGGRCSYCGNSVSRQEATIDHIVPRAQGGVTSWDNVALSCKRCNSVKSSRTPEEANMPLLIKPYNPRRKHK